MFKHAFGFLMGDFRFDNKMFSCVGTHLAWDSAVKNRHDPKESKNITALSGKYHFYQTFWRLEDRRKLLLYLRKIKGHKPQRAKDGIFSLSIDKQTLLLIKNIHQSYFMANKP